MTSPPNTSSSSRLARAALPVKVIDTHQAAAETDAAAFAERFINLRFS